MISGEQTQDLLQLRRAHPAEQAAQSALEGRDQARQVRDRLRKVFRRRHARPGPGPVAGAAPGENTGRQTMADSEAAVQRYGWRCTTAGSSILGLTLIVVLLFRENLRDASPPFVTFCVIMSAVAIGGVFLSVGIGERLNRYGRTLSRANTAQLAEVMRQQDQIQRRANDNAELIRHVADCVSDLGERVANMEKVIERVPSYPESVLDGVDLANGIGSERDKNR